MSEWQPIETAPTDGRYIIAGRFISLGMGLGWVSHSRWITPEEIAEICGDEADDFEAGWTDGNNDDEAIFPTHWMPLSKPETHHG